MVYDILDFFTVRNSIGSIVNYTESIKSENYLDDILNIFYTDKKFQEIIQVCSYSLYKTLIEKNGSKKKLKQSLKSYYSRMCSRTTPYSLLASVSIGEFNFSQSISKTIIVKKSRADMEWLLPIIKIIEEENFNNLYVRWNDDSKIIVNKLVIDWNTCLLHSNKSEVQIGNKSHINYTDAVKLVREKSNKFVRISEIENFIMQNYPGMQINIIKKFIKELFEKEYLLSNLRGNMLSNDLFKDILDIIESYNYYANFDLNRKLKEIDALIDKYNKTCLGGGIFVFDKLAEKMNEIYSTKNFLRVDLLGEHSVQLHDNSKNNLLNFANFLYSKGEEYFLPELEIWSTKYMERYATTEQKLIEVIDNNEGIGLPIYRSEVIKNDITSDLLQEFDYHINNMNRSDDSIDIKDIINLKNNGYDELLVDDSMMELSFFVQKDNRNNKNIFSLAPMIGHNNIGATLGRFLYALKDKTKIINKLQNLNNNYDEVEIVYYPQIERIGNIMNTNSNRRYVLEFGSAPSEYQDKRIQISDILINVGEFGIYFKHIKTGRRLKFYMNHATRLDFAPAIVKFIIEAQKYKRKDSLSLLYKLHRILINYNVAPRITFDNIIVYEKTWRLINARFKNLNEEQFIIEFLEYVKEIKMDRYVFLQEFDNRILIDIFDKDNQKVIYKSFKNNNNLVFIENIFKYDMVSINQDNEFILSEIVFYFKKLNND